MSLSLGRDNLGRLIYIGDIVAHKGRSYVVIDGGNSTISVIERGREKRHENELFCEPEAVTVDLEASIPMSNYARYFSDLGTWDVIMRSYCHDALKSTKDAMFWFFFERNLRSKQPSIRGFKEWLREVATL